jgi:FemAB-related protein (PEP-CTERM system-associated)
MREAWDDFAARSGTIYHTSGFRQILLDSFGYKCRYHAVLDEGRRIHAIVPMIEGRNLALRKVTVSLPFVNFMDIPADSDEAHRFAVDRITGMQRELGLGYVELRVKESGRPIPDRRGWESNGENYTFSLPLDPDEDKVLALSAGSNRNHVRKAYKSGQFNVSFDPSHLPAFYEVYAERMKQLGSPAPGIAFFRRFFDYLPEAAHLLSVLDSGSGKVIGGMLLLLSPGDGTLYYPYGSASVDYNRYYINNFMYWEAVRFGIRHGMKQLDLGRSPAGSGTYKFKQQWGAAPEQLIYQVYSGENGTASPPDKRKLHLFVELWKRLPDFVTTAAGKRLMKYIMP